VRAGWGTTPGLCAKCKCDAVEQACVDRGRCEPIARANRHIAVDVRGERLVAHLVEVKFRGGRLAARINQFVAELAARLLTEQDVIEVECGPSQIAAAFASIDCTLYHETNDRVESRNTLLDVRAEKPIRVGWDDLFEPESPWKTELPELVESSLLVAGATRVAESCGHPPVLTMPGVENYGLVAKFDPEAVGIGMMQAFGIPIPCPTVRKWKPRRGSLAVRLCE
jgi:hypothetical protein